jgi:hypothetical protein
MVLHVDSKPAATPILVWKADKQYLRGPLFLRVTAAGVLDVLFHPLFVFLFLVVLLMLVKYRYSIAANTSVFSSMGLIAGWFAAFYLGLWGQRRQALEKIRHEGYQAMRKRFEECLDLLSSLKAKLDSIPGMVDRRREFRDLAVVRAWGKLPDEILKEISGILFSFPRLHREFEGYHIVFLELSRLLNCLMQESSRLGGFLSHVGHRFNLLLARSQDIPDKGRAIEQLIVLSKEAGQRIFDVECYIHDFRVELQNFVFCTHVFEKLDRRVTLIPKYRTLLELARNNIYDVGSQHLKGSDEADKLAESVMLEEAMP